MKKLFCVIVVLIYHTLAYSQVYRIPTVVHVIHNGAAQDLTNSEVQSLIDSVNLNLRGLSNNTAVSRQIFDTLWADTEIELCLAKEDPNGIATTGIVRVPINFNFMTGDYATPRSFSTAWNTTEYLNIWIISGGMTAAGGQTFTNLLDPGNVPYGFVVSQGTHFSTIATHELGHYFSLFHTFESTDHVDDTPCSTDGTGLGSLICDPALLTVNTCSNEANFWGTTDPPDMIENFMSYHSSCAKMFTKGQKDRMRSYLMNNHASMLNNAATTCNLTLGATKLNKNQEVLIYPNPASNQLFIESTKPIERIFIYNLQGQLLKTTMPINSSIDIKKLPTGLYVIVAEGRDFITQQKIIIQ